MPAVSAPSTGQARDRSSTAVRFRREVADLRRTTKILLGFIGVLVLTVATVGVLQWKGSRDRARELVELRARADSLALESQRMASQLQSEVAGLREALTQSQAETEQLRRELAAGGNAATLARLRNALTAAESRQRALLGAAGVDYRAISRSNQDAVVLMVVEFQPGDVVTGTGFAIDSQGTIVTNRHVLAGEDGTRRPARIGVQFAGSAQLFRADLVAVAEDMDIGVVRAPIRGGNPHVAGLARERNVVERGDPVAMLGYPLGFDLPMDRAVTAPIADPSLIVGTVSKVLTNLVQVDGYGAPGPWQRRVRPPRPGDRRAVRRAARVGRPHRLRGPQLPAGAVSRNARPAAALTALRRVGRPPTAPRRAASVAGRARPRAPEDRRGSAA
jgi:S1-C subfamily serine protease